MEFLKELWLFLRVRKKLWLAPIIIVMLILGGLLIIAESSVVAPFIYTLFLRLAYVYLRYIRFLPRQCHACLKMVKSLQHHKKNALRERSMMLAFRIMQFCIA